MSFTEDFSVFFNNSEFSDTVNRSNGSKFEALFDEEFFDPETGELVLDTTKPYLTSSAAAIGDLQKKEVVTVNVKGVTKGPFTVMKIKPDGTGLVVIQLTKLV